MINDPKEMGNILEERQFTNPHVRFRRIGGRVIPIYNKKRIGQTVTDTGEKVAGIGLVAAGSTYVANKFKLNKLFAKIPPINLKSVPTDGFKLRTIKAGIKMGGNSARFLVKNPYKAALGLILGGAAAKVYGDTLQMDSKFGKDYFLIEDKQTGMGS